MHGGMAVIAERDVGEADRGSLTHEKASTQSPIDPGPEHCQNERDAKQTVRAGKTQRRHGPSWGRRRVRMLVMVSGGAGGRRMRHARCYNVTSRPRQATPCGARSARMPVFSPPEGLFPVDRHTRFCYPAATGQALRQRPVSFSLFSGPGRIRAGRSNQGSLRASSRSRQQCRPSS